MINNEYKEMFDPLDSIIENNPYAKGVFVGKIDRKDNITVGDMNMNWKNNFIASLYFFNEDIRCLKQRIIGLWDNMYKE